MGLFFPKSKIDEVDFSVGKHDLLVGELWESPLPGFSNHKNGGRLFHEDVLVQLPKKMDNSMVIQSEKTPTKEEKYAENEEPILMEEHYAGVSLMKLDLKLIL